MIRTTSKPISFCAVALLISLWALGGGESAEAASLPERIVLTNDHVAVFRSLRCLWASVENGAPLLVFADYDQESEDALAASIDARMREVLRAPSLPSDTALKIFSDANTLEPGIGRTARCTRGKGLRDDCRAPEDPPGEKDKLQTDSVLPDHPSEEEQEEIGLALAAALETWHDEHAHELLNRLRVSGVKPLSEMHYIGEWYRKPNNILYSSRGTDVRVQYEVELKRIGGRWKNVGDPQKIVWRKRME